VIFKLYKPKEMASVDAVDVKAQEIDALNQTIVSLSAHAKAYADQNVLLRKELDELRIKYSGLLRTITLHTRKLKTAEYNEEAAESEAAARLELFNLREEEKEKSRKNKAEYARRQHAEAKAHKQAENAKNKELKVPRKKMSDSTIVFESKKADATDELRAAAKVITDRIEAKKAEDRRVKRKANNDGTDPASCFKLRRVDNLPKDPTAGGGGGGEIHTPSARTTEFQFNLATPRSDVDYYDCKTPHAFAADQHPVAAAAAAAAAPVSMPVNLDFLADDTSVPATASFSTESVLGCFGTMPNSPFSSV